VRPRKVFQPGHSDFAGAYLLSPLVLFSRGSFFFWKFLLLHLKLTAPHECCRYIQYPFFSDSRRSGWTATLSIAFTMHVATVLQERFLMLSVARATTARRVPLRLLPCSSGCATQQSTATQSRERYTEGHVFTDESNSSFDPRA